MIFVFIAETKIMYDASSVLHNTFCDAFSQFCGKTGHHWVVMAAVLHLAGFGSFIQYTRFRSLIKNGGGRFGMVLFVARRVGLVETSKQYYQGSPLLRMCRSSFCPSSCSSSVRL